MLHLPAHFNGIDIVLARPNRFQLANKSLFAGPGMRKFGDLLLGYGYRLDECSIRLHGYGCAPTGTTKQLLLGPITSQADLDKNQCYVHIDGPRRTVRTYLPQDADDFQPLEDDDMDDNEAASDGKDYAATKFANYRFWVKRAVQKLFTIDPMPSARHVPYSLVSTESLPKLLPALGDTLFLDIECSPKDNHLICIGFCGLSSDRVYVWFPWDHNKLSTGNMTAAAVAWFKRLAAGRIVAHNAFFDLSFLHNFYKMPFSRCIEDTMLMHNRMFAEAEKDLGHCIAYWLNDPYHKDTSGRFYIATSADMQRMAKYNAADVAATRLLWQTIHAAAKATGYSASIAQVNASCYPLLICGCTGIVINEAKLAAARAASAGYVIQLQRIWRALTGEGINFNSGPQIANYLYNKMLFEPPLGGRSKTPTDKDALYALKMKYPACVAIDVLLAAKEHNAFVTKSGFEIYYRNEHHHIGQPVAAISDREGTGTELRGASSDDSNTVASAIHTGNQTIRS